MTNKDLYIDMLTASTVNIDKLMSELSSKIPPDLADKAIPALDMLSDTEAWTHIRDILGREAETAGMMAFVDANDVHKLFILRMLTQKVIGPLVTEVLNLKTMVRTLTVSKEVTL